MLPRVYVLGDIDLEQKDFENLAKSTDYQLAVTFKFISYDELKTYDVKRILLDKQAIAIILGPSPHMMKGLDGANSLSHYYRLNGNQDEFPYLFEMINSPTSRQAFKPVFLHIKKLLDAVKANKNHGITYVTEEYQLVEAVEPDKIDPLDLSLDTIQSELKNMRMDVYSYLEQKPVPLDTLLQAALSLDKRMGKRNPLHARKARAIYNLIIDSSDAPVELKKKALFQDGICYYNGRGVRRNNERAKLRFEAAEQLGYPEAVYMQYFIYKRYQANTDIDTNPKMAVDRLVTASEQGFKLAEFELGEFNRYSTLKMDSADKAFKRFIQYCNNNQSKLTNDEWYRLAQCHHFGYDKGKIKLQKAFDIYTELTTRGYHKGWYGLGLITLYHPYLSTGKTFDKYWQQGINLGENRCLYAGALHLINRDGRNSKNFEYLRMAMQQGYVKALIMLIYLHWRDRQYTSIDTLLEDANLTDDYDLTFIIEAYHKKRELIPIEFSEYINREFEMYRPAGVIHHSNHIHRVRHEVIPPKLAAPKPVVVEKVKAVPTPPKKQKGTIRPITGGSLPLKKKSGR